ncbi:hypothetical protein [Pleomorphomonas carboxyditropha]|uniref:Helix-turn-helix domain-containing protein n=1 Tax=Pleomorphomonas carboxyditropha TaxID=2023338 RepID=A0A2G9X121_9HYPH|nr:hypothetical protein [Pleomorphomonas carboxyditropha]PIP00668.1 hypothetical protein CJ014_00765 [Pleomorphomonas carboxyditropha]
MSDDFEDADEVLSSGGDEYSPGSAFGMSAEVASVRVVSLEKIATLLDRDRNTISAWIKKGAPVLMRGDRSKGVPWRIDVADFVKWMVDQAKPSGGRAPDENDDDFDWDALLTKNSPTALAYRDDYAATRTREYKFAELERSLARIQPLLDLMAADRAMIAAKLHGIGRQVSQKDLSDLPRETIHRVQETIDKRIREALEGMRDDNEMMEEALALAES